MTQVVRHKSRIVTEDLQFTANGETSWSFIAEGDGEIYAVESDNVASYTIGGNPITLPFPLVNKNEYTVAITKTTPAQVADIQFKTRRAVNKTNTINVPDFGAYGGRYVYVLTDNNEVQKIDSNLLVVSNYISAGAWTVNPIVGTIPLPVIPDPEGYLWTSIVFVGNRFLIFGSSNGGTNTQTYHYACQLNFSDEIYSPDGVTLNGYSSYDIGSANSRFPKNSVYNFINDTVYYKSVQDANILHSLFKFNNTTNAHENVGFPEWVNVFPQNGLYSAQINPVNQYLSGIADHSAETLRTFNYKKLQNNSDKWGFSKKYGLSICMGTSVHRFNLFDVSGNNIQAFNSVNNGVTNNFGATDVKGYNDYLIASNQDTINIYNTFTDVGNSYTCPDATSLGTSNYFIQNILRAKANNLFVSLVGSSVYVPTNRILIYDESEIPSQFAYLDLVDNAVMMQVDDLMI